MKNSLLLVFTLLFFVITSSYAASLNKYNRDSAYSKPPSTHNKTSLREEKIRQAVSYIKNAKPRIKLRLIKRYKKLVNQATQKEKYGSAKFYTEILKRSK